MSRKAILLLAVCALLLMGAGLFIKSQNGNSVKGVQTVKKSISAESLRLDMQYTEPLQSENLTDQDQKDKFVIRLTSHDPAILVSVKYEDGLRTISTLTKQDTLDMVADNASKALPGQYPEYKLVEQKEIEVNGKQAVELTFSYKGPSGEKAKKRMQFIKLDDDRVVYVSAQTQESEFDSINDSVLNDLFGSINFK